MKDSRARGRVQLAACRLASEQPLHGGLISAWRLIEDQSILTMAIGYARGRLLLSFNPKFVESLTLDELVAVLSHEANHIILGHCEHEPVTGESKTARIISEEVTANEFVVGPLPLHPIVLADYPALKPFEGTDDRYQQLLSILPPEVETLDDHSRWEQILKSGQMSGAVIKMAIATVWNRLTPEQKENIKLPDAAKKIVEEAVKAAGTLQVGGGMACIPWQQVLRQYVGRSLCRRPVFTRPPRRFPDLVGILPGRGRQGSKPRILGAIDTSGSMSPATIAGISAELAVMSRSHIVTVVECDTQIRAVYNYRPITEVQGRGGTDFRPVFEASFLQDHRPDLVVYFTDGRGKCPVEAPRIPVIWCLTANGRQPSNWGKTVRMS